MPPEVAVCIVTYNSESDIGSALRALLEQDVETQIHVWDNASRDGTVAEVAKFPAARLHTDGINLGFCAANNRLLALTQAPFVLFLNPDARLRPGCLQTLLTTLKAAPPETAGVGPKMIKPAGDDGEIIIDSVGIALSRRNLSPHDKGQGEPDRGQYDRPGPSFGSSFACALWKRSAIEKLRINGEFLDEDFFAYYEDVDVCWRAARLGLTFWYEPRAVCEHRRGRPEDHGAALAARAFVNRYLMVIANEDGKRGLTYLLWIIPRECLRLIWKCFEIKGFAVAWRMLAGDWADAWLKRRLLREKAGESR